RGILAAVAAAVIALLFGFAAPAQADDVSQIANGLSGSRLYVTTGARSAVPDAEQAAIRQALDRNEDADVRAVVVQSGVTKERIGPMLKSVAQRVDKGKTYVAITAAGKMMALSKALSGKELHQLIAQTAGGDIKT